LKGVPVCFIPVRYLAPFPFTFAILNIQLNLDNPDIPGFISHIERLALNPLRFTARYLFYIWTLVADRLCGVVVRVPGYTTEMYCVSCEVRTGFIYVM
jgi:hypothetical protein